MPHLTKERWVIVSAAESPRAEQHQLTDSHFDAKISTSISLHDDKDKWMILLIKVAGPCFVVYNKD